VNLDPFLYGTIAAGMWRRADTLRALFGTYCDGDHRQVRVERCHRDRGEEMGHCWKVEWVRGGKRGKKMAVNEDASKDGEERQRAVT